MSSLWSTGSSPPDANALGWLRRLEAAARTKEALWTTIGELLDRFPAEACQNYLSNCGYEFT